MSWENFDWLDFELGEYKESLNHRVREAYRAAYAVLEQAYREGKEKIEEQRKKAMAAEDFDLTSQSRVSGRGNNFPAYPASEKIDLSLPCGWLLHSDGTGDERLF